METFPTTPPSIHHTDNSFSLLQNNSHPRTPLEHESFGRNKPPCNPGFGFVMFTIIVYGLSLCREGKATPVDPPHLDTSRIFHLQVHVMRREQEGPCRERCLERQVQR